MIVFDELRLTPNCEELVLNLNIPVGVTPWLESANIKSIILDTHKTYLDAGPSNNGNGLYKKEFEEDSHHRYIVIPQIDLIDKDIDLKNDLIYVYVEMEPVFNPRVSIPCDADKRYEIGIVFNKCPIYNRIMGVINEVKDNCDVPRNFIDEYLRFKAFTTAADTTHFMEANRLYEKFFYKKGAPTVKKCNCHGRHTI